MVTAKVGEVGSISVDVLEKSMMRFLRWLGVGGGSLGLRQ